MDATPSSPAASAGVHVPAEGLAEIRAAYGRGLYLDAWRLAQGFGPLPAWRGAEGLVLAGRLAAQLGARKLGMRLHLRAFREHPDSVPAWTWALRALGARRGPHAALESMRRSGRAPEHVELLSLRAELLSGLRDHDEAERSLSRALALDPANAWLHVVRAELFREADAYEAGLEAAERALALRPWYRPAVDARADLLVLLGKDEEAFALLVEAAGRLQAPSVQLELAKMLMERGRHEDAEAALDRLEELTPLRERVLAGHVDGMRSDAAYHRGHLARAVELARRAGGAGVAFYEGLAGRLESGAAPGRVELPVPWVRQHRLTCAPATMSALVRRFGREAPHLEIAEAICYDGTPDHAQRSWAAAQGLVAREFTVTWDAATALLDRGVPFALTTVEPGNAHMQAVVGYDRLRRTLLLRDPTFRYKGEIVGEEGLAAYAASGPKGLVLLPPEEAHRLDGLDLPEVSLHDLYLRVQAALVAHDRAGAAEAAAELRGAAPGHRLALQADRSIASYDADEPGRLRATDALLERFPDDVNLRLSRQASLADLGRRDARVEWLRKEHARAGHPLLALALADVLREDARAWPEALRLLRGAVSRMASNAGFHHVLGHVLWDRGDRDAALAAYRAAACLEPTDERFAESYFLAARLLRRAPEAVAFLHGRFERHGSKAAWPAFTLYEALDLLDRRREALEVLDRALERRPDDGPLLLFAARARAAGADPAGAEALLARAGAAARPADVKRTGAQLAETRGDLAAAAALWSEVADLEPFNLGAVRAAARLLEATKGKPDAVAFLRARVDRHPHHHGLCRLLAEWLADAEPGAREAAIRKILDVNPSDAWAWRELGLALAGTGRVGEALEAVARSAEVDPHSAQLHAVRGSVLVDAGRIDEAKASLRRSVQASVDQEWAIHELLRISSDAEEREAHLGFVQEEIVGQVLSGDALLAYQSAASGILEPERLVGELRAAWEARPDLWHAWVALARQLGIAGRPAEAVELLRQATGRFELLPRVWLELAHAHRAAGDRDAQRAALERALALSPAWPEAVTPLAEILHASREFEAERAILEHAARRSPTSALLRGWLADARWATGDREAAVAELERALHLSPRYAWAWEALVRFSRELGRPDAPLALAERIATERPHDASAWVLVARARRGVGERLEAIEKALAVSPRHGEAHELRVDVLSGAGRLDEALEAARAPILAGNVPRGLRLRAARLLAARGEPGAARLALKELLEAEPDQAEAWAQLADWEEEAGRHEDAVAAARRLVRLAPNEPVPHGYLGRALLSAGDRAEGKAALRRAIELDPAYAFGARRLFDAELEDRAPDAAAALLPVLERQAPDDAPLFRLRVAAARADEAAAFGELDALARGEDRDALDLAAKALVAAGWGRRLDDRLSALLGDPAAGRAAGALFVARAANGWRWRFAGRRRLDALLADPRPTRAALGAAEARLGQLALPARRFGLVRFLARHGARIAGDVDAWGMAGYALSSARRHERAVAWLAGWKERSGVRPWMLANLAASLRDLGRHEEAAGVSTAALALPPDHTTPMHEVALAMHGALSGDEAALGRLGSEHDALGGSHRFLVELVRALAASEAGGDRRSAFEAALAHVAAADRARPVLSTEPYLRHARRATLLRIASRRAGGGRLASFHHLVARLRLWSRPPR